MPTVTGYCSWCFTKTKHTQEQRNHLRRNVYRCTGCWKPTLICRTPRCTAMAKRGKRWDAEFCAAHGGEIPGFGLLERRLDSLEDWEVLFKREAPNLRKVSTLPAAAVGGAVLLGPLAFLGAPAVGGAVGSTFFGLTGAAATTKGLAALGLGSLAAGGYGMAGGIAVITTLGAATGGALSGVIAHAYMGDVKGFKIRKIQDGEGASVLVINGFLTQGAKDQEKDWLPLLRAKYQRHPWYLVEWESRRLARLGQLVAATGGKAVLSKALAMAAKKASKAGAKKLSPVGWVLTAAGFAKNDWHLAMVKAAQTGHILADLLARTPTGDGYIVLGHSLGARVAHYALHALAGRDEPVVREAHLLGGAVGIRPAEGWRKVASACPAGVYNYW